MSKWKDRLNKWIVGKVGLPADVVMDLPRITMIGHFHMYIENHNGVVVFSESELRLLLKKGQISVKGSGFVLKTILPEEILLEGKIERVQFIDET